MRFICLLIQCNINTLSILRLTFILFEIKLQLNIPEFFMFPPHFNMHISSQKSYWLLLSPIFVPVWMCALNLPLKLWGRISICIVYYNISLLYITHCIARLMMIAHYNYRYCWLMKYYVMYKLSQTNSNILKLRTEVRR